MPKIMIIKYQQFAKTNTFSLSFHTLFSPFLHIFPHFSPRHIEIRIWGWAKMGLDPPNYTIFCVTFTILQWDTKTHYFYKKLCIYTTNLTLIQQTLLLRQTLSLRQTLLLRQTLSLQQTLLLRQTLYLRQTLLL